MGKESASIEIHGNVDNKEKELQMYNGREIAVTIFIIRSWNPIGPN